jgi:hypothetical protein
LKIAGLELPPRVSVPYNTGKKAPLLSARRILDPSEFTMRRFTFFFVILGLASMAAVPGSAGAEGEIYAWAISASDTDPFVQIDDPLTEPGVVELWLWLVCHEAGGIAAAEFDVTVSGDLDFVAFNDAWPQEPIIGFSDATGHTIRLGIGGCPEPPFLAGTLLVIDHGGGGSLCLGPSASNGLNVSVDCGYPQPVAFPNGVLGFSSDGSAPCVIGDCVDAATGVDDPRAEESTWGRVKGVYR